MQRMDGDDAPGGLAGAPTVTDAPASDAVPIGSPGRLRRRLGRLMRRLWRRLLRVVLLLVVPLALAGGALAWWLQGGGVAETDNAYVKADKIPVSAEIAGTVRTVLVR
jgi:hypothetical protein